MPLNRIVLLGTCVLGATVRMAGADCSLAVDPVAFGTIELGRSATGTGSLVVRCDEATSFTIAIAPGEGTQRMRGPGGAHLDYDLFQDAGHSRPWGDGREAGSERTGQSDGTEPVRLTVYGMVPAQPDAVPGSYADSLLVTLSF